MAKIIANHRNIYTCLQKCSRTAVPHDMWRDTTFRQPVSRLGGQPDVLGQHVGDAVARQWCAAGIAEEKILSFCRRNDSAQR